MIHSAALEPQCTRVAISLGSGFLAVSIPHSTRKERTFEMRMIRHFDERGRPSPAYLTKLKTSLQRSIRRAQREQDENRAKGKPAVEVMVTINQLLFKQVMQHQDVPEANRRSTDPEIIPPGTDRRESRVWKSTGQRHTIHVQITPLGPVGLAGFLILMVVLGFVGIVLLLGAALVGIAAAGLLIVGGIVSAVLRGQFRR